MPAIRKARIQCPEPECTSSFTRNSDLKRHRDTCHLNQRDFKCDICDSKYQQASHLKTHMNKHNDTRVYCDSCSFSCTDPSSLSRHRRLRHSRHAPAAAQAPVAAIPAPANIPANIPADLSFLDWDQSIAAYPYLFPVPSTEDFDDHSGGTFWEDISTGTDPSRSASSAASSASSFPPAPATADLGGYPAASQPWNLPADPFSSLLPPASVPEEPLASLEAPSMVDDGLFDQSYFDKYFDFSGGLDIDPNLL